MSRHIFDGDQGESPTPDGSSLQKASTALERIMEI